MDMKGYAGKILRIDLTNNEVTESPTSDYAAKYLGGRGIALKIHWDEVPPEIEPYDPENRLIFMTGLTFLTLFCSPRPFFKTDILSCRVFLTGPRPDKPRRIDPQCH